MRTPSPHLDDALRALQAVDHDALHSALTSTLATYDELRRQTGPEA